MNIQSAEESVQIQFMASYEGTVEWITPDGTTFTAQLNGDPVPINIVTGDSAVFMIPKSDGGALPGLVIDYEGTEVPDFFTLSVSPQPWTYRKPEIFTCTDSDHGDPLGSIGFSLKTQDGILIVGTIDIGGIHDR